MFANLKCLREGSFQITINNLRLHLPLCNKGVIYGCIERSFMTLYDFKERALMNVPPLLNAAHQVFLMISLMHHNIIHFLITMYVGFNIVWQSEIALTVSWFLIYSDIHREKTPWLRNFRHPEFPEIIHQAFISLKGNFLITTCASWAILATSRKKWPPRGRLERNTF